MKIGIIGAGMIGGTLGQLWAKAGHELRFGTRNSEALHPLITKVGTTASAGSPKEAAAFGEIVLFAAPFGAWPTFAKENVALLDGKTVIDAANPYAQRDGAIVDAVEKENLGSTGFIAQLLPKSDVIKAFNTVYYAELAAQANRKGEKLAIPVAGDSGLSLDLAIRLINDAGFDHVVVGDLIKGRQLDPGNPVYGKSLTAVQIKSLLGLN